MIGYHYGKSFQLSDIRGNPRTCQAQAKVQPMPPVAENESRYAIHPAALDGIFQMSIMGQMQGQPHRLARPQVPVVFQDLIVRPVPEGNAPSGFWNVESRSWMKGAWALKSKIKATSPATGEQMVSLETELHDFAYERPQKPPARRPYQRLLWRPDITMLNRETASECIRQTLASELAVATKLQRFLVRCMAKLIDGVTEDQLAKASPMYQNLYLVFSKACSAVEYQSIPESQEEEYSETLNTRITEIQSYFDGVSRVLRGEPKAKYRPSPHDLISAFDSVMLASVVLPYLCRVVQLIAHKFPRIRVLDLSGSKVVSSAMLEMLNSDGATLYQDYTCCTHTAVEPGQHPNVSLSTSAADLESDAYDVVIVSEVSPLLSYPVALNSYRN